MLTEGGNIDSETLLEINIFNRITKICFKQCVKFYNTEAFINHEESCVKQCAKDMDKNNLVYYTSLKTVKKKAIFN